MRGDASGVGLVADASVGVEVDVTAGVAGFGVGDFANGFEAGVAGFGVGDFASGFEVGVGMGVSLSVSRTGLRIGGDHIVHTVYSVGKAWGRVKGCFKVCCRLGEGKPVLVGMPRFKEQ